MAIRRRTNVYNSILFLDVKLSMPHNSEAQASSPRSAIADEVVNPTARNCSRRDGNPAGFHEHLRLRVAAAAAAFLCAWLIVNRSIFFQVTRDSGDTATILLQVYNAKRFHELLGNYSRWHFHHPGPGFIYILAFGDAIFRNLLQIVPAPWNSAALTLLVLYTCFLFATIFIFQRQSRSPWVLPATVLASLWFIYAVDRTFPGSASGGIWMPYIIMYCFLLFVAACASLAMGNGRHLPLVVLCGALLVHGHVAQLLFVGALSSAAVAAWLIPRVRQIGVSPAVKLYRSPLLISLGIALLFAFPILLEAIVHQPNNLQNISSYLREHRGAQNGWLTCVKYVCSFIAFIPDPEVVLTKPAAHLLSRAAARPYVLAYWGMFLALLAAAIATRIARQAKVPPFLRYIIFELILITALVVYWARKIAGGMFAFNAYFFFAVFLLASFALVAYLADAWIPGETGHWSWLVSCLLPFTMFAAPQQFLALQGVADQQREPEIRAIVAEIPAGNDRLFIAWSDYRDWPAATGIASWLEDRHRAFCVSADWAFMFAPGEDCQNLSGVEELEIVRPPNTCASPCRTLFQNDEFAVTLTPFVQHTLPFDLQTDGSGMLPTDFYGAEGRHGPMWSKRNSSVHFLLSEDWNPSPIVRVVVKGVVRPGDPVGIKLNDHPLGMITQAGWVSPEFQVPESVFHAGGDNTLSFTVDRAGPAGADPRTLGFQLWGIQFQRQ